MRKLAVGLLAGAGLGLGLGLGIAPAVAGDSVTTRIEPRPFYGAVVTVESGVRVFRPLPRHDHVIINPGNAPVVLGINDLPYGGAGLINQNVNVNRFNRGRW
jgi:hypothetical protein